MIQSIPNTINFLAQLYLYPYPKGQNHLNHTICKKLTKLVVVVDLMSIVFHSF